MPRDDRGCAPPSAAVQLAEALRIEIGGRSFSTLTTFELDEDNKPRMVGEPQKIELTHGRRMTGTLTMTSGWRAALLTFMG